MLEGTCRLCRQHGALCESHVLPAFVCRWLKETSLGHIRSTAEPNRRIQDGLKEYWLCSSCENRLSEWETQFAELFRELHDRGVGEIRIAYGGWALKFATSVSWRVLLYFGDRSLPLLSPADQGNAQSASATWADFLLGRREHPGEFQQHLVHLDAPCDVGALPVSPFLNRYLLRTWDLDVVTGPDACVTYAKLGRIVIFGLIRVRRPRDWKGTKLRVHDGVFGATDCSLPGFLPHFWNGRAELLARGLNGLSTRQRGKVADMYQSIPVDELAKSEAFRAMTADVFLSGDSAFPGDSGEDRTASGG